jgi:hypothetical protein
MMLLQNELVASFKGPTQHLLCHVGYFIIICTSVFCQFGAEKTDTSSQTSKPDCCKMILQRPIVMCISPDLEEMFCPYLKA